MEDGFNMDYTFRIEDILLPKKQLIAFVRFLIAARHLTSLVGAISELRESGYRRNRERIEFLVLHLVGSAKEAADRFRDCDSNGMFAPLETGSESLAQFSDNIKKARTGSEKGNPDSLYSKILKPMRDGAAFHVASTDIAATLEKLRGYDYRPFSTDESGSASEIQLVREVVGLSTWGKRFSEKEVVATFDAVWDLQVALSNVAHDFYVLITKISTLDDDWTI